MSQSDSVWPVPQSAPLFDRLGRWCYELVSIPSVYGNEASICDRLDVWAASVFSDRIQRFGNSLVLGDLADTRPTVVLAGHLDTVLPPEGIEAEPHIDGEYIRGLGSADMKSGLAVMCAIAEDLADKPGPYNLVLVLYEKEEGPYVNNGLGVVLAGVPELSDADFCLCMEPTNNVVELGCNGSIHATITFTGKAAHSARPWLGENAIHKAGELLTKLGRLEPRKAVFEDLAFLEVISATTVKGGRARTTIPERLDMNLNYRFAPGKSLEQAEKELRDFVGPEASVEITDLAPSGRVCADNPIARRLVEFSGKPAEPKQAWTDVAQVTAAGLDAVNFGPADYRQAHKVGEHAHIPAMVHCYDIVMRLLRG